MAGQALSIVRAESEVAKGSGAEEADEAEAAPEAAVGATPMVFPPVRVLAQP
jgi:hypothetical protein